jgi:hypothetical protein
MLTRLTIKDAGTVNKMPEGNLHEKRPTNGIVRIRSNVCTEPNGWHLVPGDLVKRYSLPHHNLTEKQKDEMMYYVPCSYCHRTIFQILEEGCDEPVCRSQGLPSTAEARLRMQRFKDISGPTEA